MNERNSKWELVGVRAVERVLRRVASNLASVIVNQSEVLIKGIPRSWFVVGFNHAWESMGDDPRRDSSPTAIHRKRCN